MIDKKLGHYEILSLLGQGGMGEVYRARDGKLEREVALKILPREMSNDPERIARFQREARMLATLQHPNIASVYGFEDDPNARFLVMELVEGESLDAILHRGALSTDRAIEIARQLTEGLEAAHERGIVHRDLKPANIKIDPDGVVKILDFGLARAYTGDADQAEDLENSPTITAAMTQAGTILGTAAYMSPEQAKGRNLDKRADIWAFGTILYEMLAGKRLFDAPTISETLAGVLLTEIDWDALPAQTPAYLRQLLERCLQRNPKLRLRDIGEARVLLADPAASGIFAAAGSVPSPKGSVRWPWIVALPLLLVLGFFVGRAGQRAGESADLPPLLFAIQDVKHDMIPGSIAIAPAGNAIVFARVDSLAQETLWVRRLDEDVERMIPGSVAGKQPFWSPDGKNIGFFVSHSLYRIAVDGGAPSLIASLETESMGASWNEDGVILVGSDSGPIVRVSATGGQPQDVTQVELGVEDSHCWPSFLPDGQHFVFLSDASSDDGHRIYVHSLDGSEKRILKRAVRSAVFLDYGGALLLSQDGQLFAYPFDLEKRELVGPPMLVQDKIHAFNQQHELPLTLSKNGMLAFQETSDASFIVRVALDGSGQENLLSPDRYRNPRISPDGNSLAFEIQGTTDERLIWVEDMRRGARTLVSERGYVSDSPVWSPDGRYVYYGSSVKGPWQIYRRRLGGAGAPEYLGAPPGTDDIAVLDISADGEWLLVGGQRIQTRTNDDIFLARIGPDSLSWQAWIETPARESFARFSPDSRWIAFTSNASGQNEIYVAPVLGGAMRQQWMASVHGGTDPAWSPDGSTLYYRNPTGVVMAVPVAERGDDLEFGRPEPLMTILPPRVGYLRNAYDCAPDGKSLVAFVPTERQDSSIRIRTGWRKW